MSETPTLAEVILTGIKTQLMQLHTCMPGTVQAYDKIKQTVDVLPAFQGIQTITGDPLETPIISDVPVVFFGSALGQFKFKLEKGDKVLLVFAQRSLENWLEKGGQNDPEDERMHALTDALALPWAFESNGPDLLSLFTDTLDVLIGLTVVDPISGALPLSPTVITQLELIKAKYEAMK